jgi:hypothetical protein
MNRKIIKDAFNFITIQSVVSKGETIFQQLRRIMIQIEIRIHLGRI